MGGNLQAAQGTISFKFETRKEATQVFTRLITQLKNEPALVFEAFRQSQTEQDGCLMHPWIEGIKKSLRMAPETSHANQTEDEKQRKLIEEKLALEFTKKLLEMLCLLCRPT